MPRLIIEGLGKCYSIRPRRGWEGARYVRLADTLRRIGIDLPKFRAAEGLWALRDISLTVGKGEILGVIGANGAGKTTLLKVLAKVTMPTTGRVTGQGRVVSLLELGMGFQPDLSGLENIQLNAALHGFSRSEVNARVDQIIEFAELHRFIETPVKHYSSGMFLRLAFSVAVNMNPDILLADEVLAVGDIGFQRRCIDRVIEAGESGTSVLFVSHDMAAIRRMCHRVLWLHHGHINMIGNAKDVVDAYERFSLTGEGAGAGKALSETTGNEFAEFISCELVDESGSPIAALTNATPVRIRLVVDVKKAPAILRGAVALSVQDKEETLLFRAIQPDDVHADAPGLHKLTMQMEGNVLNAGLFRAKCALVLEAEGRKHVLTRKVGVAFQVFRSDDNRLRPDDPPAWASQPGIIAPRLSWSAAEASQEVMP
jgi:lipopolysaccharide transport system ATP-binding protein